VIVAIDGPASGKGTLARRLAEHYGLPHLDTGLLYRATARALMDERRRFDDVPAAAEPGMAGRSRLRDQAIGSPSTQASRRLLPRASGRKVMRVCCVPYEAVYRLKALICSEIPFAGSDL
jgi:hypothetical protein